MTRKEFLKAYRETLQEAHLVYHWVKDIEKLDRFMMVCEKTIANEPHDRTWNHDGPAVVLAWKKIGGKGKPTLKALRALP